MAIKTFTTGEVLTAADTNTYLANSGLVYIKSQTIGSAVTSVTVSDAFSASFDSYRIVVAGGTSSAGSPMELVLGTTTTAYFSTLVYANYAAGAVAGVGMNSGACFAYVGSNLTNAKDVIADIKGPFLSGRTFITASFSDLSNSGSFVGYQDSTTSFTSFLIRPNAGNITGGTVTVYGYRKA
jgi:hypothetical protein